MKDILAKVTAIGAAALALFVGFALAGFGLMVMAGLAMLALVATGLALLATPFMPKAENEHENAEFETVRENPSTA